MEEERKLSNFLNKMIAAGWGFISLSEEKAKNFIDDLVKRGEISKKEGEGIITNMMERLESTGKEMETKVSDLVNKYIRRENVCTKAELVNLTQKIEDLEKKISALEKKNKGD